MDIITLAVAKKYTDESLIGGGAVAGKNCTISSITDITGGKRVTFLWTLDDGTEKTGTMDVMNGINGINGADGEDAPTITGVTLNNDNSLTITMSDGTHYDTTPIPTVKGDNGYSPSATVTRVTDGIVLTVRDKTGTTQAKADDGFSPIVTMHRNAANTGVELTITDINGSQTQTINDGSVTATVDYANVTSKPEINGVEVSGDKTLAEYGINIPTRNSQLTNDTGYITEADLPTVDTTLSSVSNNPISNKAVTDEIRATQSTLNDTISDVDANTSAINILNGNATVNGSVDKKISDALANLDRLTKQIVSELPPVSSAVENVIYLIPNSSETAYEQWTIVDDGQGGKEYALLGSTDTDLTGYYTSAQTDSLLNDKQATITGAASSVTSLNLTANKVVVSDSNGKVAASSITTTELEALDDITGNVQSQLDGKQATLTYDLVPTDNSINMVKSGGIKSALDEKQNVLTFDNTPTVNSNNPVKSGGVYTALEGKNEKFQYAELPIASVDLLGKIYMYTGATTSSLTNGLFYKCVLNPDTATYEWKEQSSGEENVQADWTETDTTADSYIKHKPNLGTASEKNATDVIRPNNHNLAESGSVYNAIIGAVSSVYQQREPIAFSGLTSSLLIPENVGTVYKTTTSGTTTDDFMQGSGIPVNVGESIGIIKAGENTILFNLMGETIDLYDFQTKTLANTVEGASTVENALSALSTNKVSTSLVPSDASSSNKLATEGYVNSVCKNIQNVYNGATYTTDTALITKIVEDVNALAESGKNVGGNISAVWTGKSFIAGSYSMYGDSSGLILLDFENTTADGTHCQISINGSSTVVTWSTPAMVSTPQNGLIEITSVLGANADATTTYNRVGAGDLVNVVIDSGVLFIPSWWGTVSGLSSLGITNIQSIQGISGECRILARVCETNGSMYLDLLRDSGVATKSELPKRYIDTGSGVSFDTCRIALGLSYPCRFKFEFWAIDNSCFIEGYAYRESASVAPITRYVGTDEYVINSNAGGTMACYNGIDNVQGTFICTEVKD